MLPVWNRVVRRCFLVLASALICGETQAAPLFDPGTITIPCEFSHDCRPRTIPGPPDRQVAPFQGTLGRPCGWRWRPTPSGTRKVRVCS
ncbi:hypothetical protein [Methylobacterium sp. sgz302541]|uniref:hypothetical protein n=1 Tax=unclassified Methylobacterium TaxID=2615210 RepID=UPI003D351989